MMQRICLAILKNEADEDHYGWITAINESAHIIDWTVIDITLGNWLDKIQTKSFDLLLARPPGAVGFFKELYDERLYMLNQVLGYKVYPTLAECKVYENKRVLAYFLQTNGIQHPKTHIFYNKKEAKVFSQNCLLPVVGKTAIGAGGSGVRIFKKRNELQTYINQAFNQGITRQWGPNLRKGDIGSRILRRLSNLPTTILYFKNKKHRATVDPQKGFVILQEYIQSDHEWRCVVIGDSFFGHKKLRTRGEMMSGTSAVSWDLPPEKLLNFVKEVIDRTGFLSQAIDVFEDIKGNYYVNEMQAFWGSKNPHQMLKDGAPGRFIYKDDKWIFEEGAFNTNNSYNLRLEHAIELYTSGLI